MTDKEKISWRQQAKLWVLQGILLVAAGISLFSTMAGFHTVFFPSSAMVAVLASLLVQGIELCGALPSRRLRRVLALCGIQCYELYQHRHTDLCIHAPRHDHIKQRLLHSAVARCAVRYFFRHGQPIQHDFR